MDHSPRPAASTALHSVPGSAPSPASPGAVGSMILCCEDKSFLFRKEMTCMD